MPQNSLISVSTPFEHMGMIVAGGGGRTDDLMYAIPPAEGYTIVAGSLCSQNDDGEAVMGLNSTNSMPLWAINNYNAYDVANTSYGFGKGFEMPWGTMATSGATNSFTSEANANTRYSPMNFIVGGRCYEIFTTEYESGTYNRDDLLVESTGSDSSAGGAGSIKNAGGADSSIAQDVQIVGQVSRGEVDMRDREIQGLSSVLFLWTRSELALNNT